MYIHFSVDPEDAVFIWDDDKEHFNFRKHGIHFKTAAKVFLDPDILIRIDEEHLQETRFNVIGEVGKAGKILFVVCSFPDSNHIRLISARIASKPEKARYIYGRIENESVDW